MQSTSLPQRSGRFGFVAAIVLGLSFLFSPLASAQDSTPEPGAVVTRTISVDGVGTVNIDPDTAQISLGVVATDESLEVAQTDVSEGLANITQVLTDSGVATEDIQTCTYNVYPIAEYDRDGNYIGIERFEVSAGVSIIVRDVDSVGPILDAAVEGGANNVWDISFYVDDPSEAASQARQLAVEDARAKADALATSSGMVITNVVSITETASPDPVAQDFDLGRGSDDMAMESAAAQVPISPGQSEVRVDVEITFEMEQAAG
jgi:uncharacterized protein YggE